MEKTINITVYKIFGLSKVMVISAYHHLWERIFSSFKKKFEWSKWERITCVICLRCIMIFWGFFFYKREGKVKKFHITVKCSKEVIKWHEKWFCCELWRQWKRWWRIQWQYQLEWYKPQHINTNCFSLNYRVILVLTS